MTESISLPTLPEGFVVRAATMDDLDDIAELLFLVEKAKYGKSESTISSYREWIRSVWETPGFHLTTDSGIVRALDGECVGYITLWHPEHAQPDVASTSMCATSPPHGSMRKPECSAFPDTRFAIRRY